MNASFATLSSKEKLILAVTFFSLIAWSFPSVGKVHAETNAPESKPTFEIKSQTKITDLQQIQIDEQTKARIDQQVALVRNYLQSKNSPLANYTEILLAQNDWKTIIAVSNAESNMGLHCYVNNCSGIFGSRGLRTYKSVPDWIVDMQNLLDKRYQGMSLAQMNGVWVVPRSANWYVASSSVYNDLTEIEQKFDTNQQLATASQS